MGLDKTDLAQAPRQSIGGFDMACKGPNPLRQSGITLRRCLSGPTPRCLFIQRGFEILAQNSAQSGFKARFDRQISEDGSKSTRLTTGQQFRQGPRFGLVTLGLTLRLFKRLAGLLLFEANLLQGLPRAFGLLFARPHQVLCGIKAADRLGQFGIAVIFSRQLLGCRIRFVEFGCNAFDPAGFIRQSLFGTRTTGQQFSRLLAQSLHGRFRFLLGGLAAGGLRGRFAGKIAGCLAFGGQSLVFTGQTAKGLFRIDPDSFLAFEIALQFGFARLEIRGPFQSALFFAFQSLHGQRQTLQSGCNSHFGLAQRTQFGRKYSLITRRLGLHHGLRLHSRQRVRMGALCLADLPHGLTPAIEQQQRFDFANIGGEIFIAGGLTRLPLQPIHLLVDLVEHIIDAADILLRRFQPQFGLVATRMQACNTGGIFQNTPTGLWFSRNNLADLPLPDHSMRARAGGRIGKQ